MRSSPQDKPGLSIRPVGIRLREAFLAVGIVGLAACGLAQDFDRPRGIYLLGSQEQPLPIASVMDKPFVDGFTARVKWEELEATQGAYDFTLLDQILSNLAGYGGSKRLTLEVLAREVPPYIIAEPGVVTYEAAATGQAGGTGATLTLPVPWDEFTLTRWEAFATALAAHASFDPATGAPEPLATHSLLAQMDAPIPGLGGIRDLGNKLLQSAVYDRAQLLVAMPRAINVIEDRFPHAHPFLLSFSMSDGANPPLNPIIFDTLRAEFFPAGRQPRLGLFRENWTCAAPVTGETLSQSRDETYILFQAKQAWLGPFLDPPSTDLCLVLDPPQPDGWQTGNPTADNAIRRTAISGPEVGIQYGIDSFGALYYELYLPDLDHAGFDDELAAMHAIIWAGAGSGAAQGWEIY